MDVLELFERFAWQTGKHVSKSVVRSNKVILGILQREIQFGG
jgi:hypothetical protein